MIYQHLIFCIVCKCAFCMLVLDWFPDITQGLVLMAPLWLQRVRLDVPGHEAPAVVDHPRLGLLPPGRGVRPQPLAQRGHAGPQLVHHRGGVHLLGPHGRLAAQDQGLYTQ